MLLFLELIVKLRLLFEKKNNDWVKKQKGFEVLLNSIYER